MQQTTCGEIPKKEIFDRRKIEKFLEKQDQIFSIFDYNQKCLYHDTSIVSDIALNYLNTKTDDLCEDQLKSLIMKEFEECEKIYPFLGDYFTQLYFSKNIKENKKYLLNSSSVGRFLETLKFKEIKTIAKKFFDNIDMQYSVSVESSIFNEILVEKNESNKNRNSSSLRSIPD